MKKLFYFGTIREVGHYWFGCRSALGPTLEIPGMPDQFFRIHVDGVFTPPKEGVYRYSTVGNLQIVSWIDRTVDSRPGSNSNLFGLGFMDAEEMLTEAIKQYPEVMNRQPRPKPEYA